MTHKYAGAEWIQAALKPKHPMSELGVAVANLLGECFAGIYHLDDSDLKKVDWDDDYVVIVKLNHRSLATYDSDHLTRLVVLSHDLCLRLDIRGASKNVLELMFHQRKRTGSLFERLPTIEEHLAQIRRMDAREGDTC